MNFVTLEFAVFFLLVLAAGLAVRGRPRTGKGLLLFFNLVFYASAGWQFVPLLLTVAVLNWGAGRLLTRFADSAASPGAPAGAASPARHRARKGIIALDIALHVALLAFFKYYEFFIINTEALLRLLGFALPPLPMADILFPVGLSFYTFQGLSYAIDLYRTVERTGRAAPESFGRVLLFVSFFPTIMAGPILRGRQFFPQLDGMGSGKAPGELGGNAGEAGEAGFFPGGELTEPPTGAQPGERLCGSAARLCRRSGSGNAPEERCLHIEEGFALILSGLFKKVVLASYLSEHVVRDVFQAPELYSSWAVLAAVYGYTMQIFCDFSGYSDLAMGIGRLMGFRLPQNFNSPYLALNLQDFWRRWHITLSLWLRDYLYIPLGGSRRGSRTLNLVITMGLGGLWHGSHLRFLVWGLMHGAGLAVAHGFQALASRSDRPCGSRLAAMRSSLPGKCLSWLLTFHFVAALWVFFRAEDMDRALEILRRLVYFGQPGDGFPLLVIPAVLAGFAIQLWGGGLYAAFVNAQARLPWALQAAVLALVSGLILKMGPDGVMPFIYFQF